MPYKDKEKQKEAQRKHYEKNRTKYRDRSRDVKNKIKKRVVNLKNSGVCVDCDQSFHHTMMEYDHVDPTNKEGSISRMVCDNVKFDAILIEIGKCDLVCVMCHRSRTWNRRNPYDQITPRPVDRPSDS